MLYSVGLATEHLTADGRHISGDTMRVVICGGGVIGACTGYFLSRSGVEVIVVERTQVAAAASGKAGGFLALDWCAGTPLDALARRSFELHATLPNEVAGDWGHRPMSAYSGFVAPERDAHRHAPSGLDWLADGVMIAGQVGTPQTTAIVHPRKFTSAMMTAAERNGTELRHGRVTGIVRHTHGAIARGVEVDGGVIEADAVVIAMGPWSLLAAEWMSLPAVFGTRCPGRRALPRISRRGRGRRHGRGVSASGREHACHRLLRRGAAAARSRRRDAR
jgi:glycine/D-amino acid oxidase-like deaminating enzyme